MKTRLIILGFIGSLSFYTFSQSTTATNTGVFGRYLGYSNNFELLSKTNNVNRMKLNGNLNYSIDGYNGNRNGNLLLGWQNTGTLYNPNRGAYSLLHLNGEGTALQEGGYRSWMKTGITFTGNNDLSYIGLRQVGTETDITETTIAWSDNQGASHPGPDDMVFRFLASGEGTTVISPDLQSVNDFDGLHVARFTSTGNFGLGNTFGTNPTGTPANLYVRPASLGHYSLSNLRSVWQQFTNRNTANGSGTGETASDGLRIGIVGNANANANGTAALYNQEARALLFSTSANTNSINLTSGTTLERMRIMSVGTPTHLAMGGFGVYNPGNITPNSTRVAISHNPSQPITRPLSLLHLGYNTGQVALIPGTDGWRPWMDIGIFTSNGTDNVYLGLKDEGGLMGDRQDAVLSWGDNQVSAFPPGNGPDNFRIIFTSTTAFTGGGTPPATTLNGLEGLRMTPTSENGIYTGVGGDPTSNLYWGNSITPTENLEVNSWGDVSDNGGSSGMRFTDLNTNSPTLANPGHGVLAVDPTGKVIYVEADGGTGIGNYCGNPQNPLTGNYEIPLNEHNFYFSNPSTPLENGINSVGIGLDCNTAPPGKLSVFRHLGENNPFEIFGVFIINDDLANSQDPNNGLSTGTYSVARGANKGNYGVKGEAEGAQANIGGKFSTSSQYDGVNGEINIGTEARAENGQTNIGLIATAIGSEAVNYGIVASASTSGGSPINYAGWFDGDVWVNGDVIELSDQNLKENIEQLSNASQIINSLNPVTYDFKHSGEYERLNLPLNHQYGLIAQEVTEVLPELVHDVAFPSEYDSLGNITAPIEYYKGLNYVGLIPILVKGIQEQNSVIDSILQTNEELKEQVSDLNMRLSQLENCLSGILPQLCQINQSITEEMTEDNQAKLLEEIKVILSDKSIIILKQNVPNPFAERTTIGYTIPESVKEAEIIFYGAEGRIINSVVIEDRGEGRLNVYADDLSTGIYLYTLVADGQVVATKRMMKK